MTSLRNKAIGLVFVSALIGILQIHLRVHSRSDPTQWLDAFNKSICGRRQVGRSFNLPTFPPFDMRHSSGPDYGNYYANDYGFDYGPRDWNAEDSWSTRRGHKRTSVGFNALPGELPWHAQLTIFFGWLGLYYQNLCGGVLIHKNLVLTAAHCILDQGNWRAQRIWIRLGLYNWHEYEGRQWLGYSKYCLPKDYKPGQYEYDDIAVIRLEEPASYNKHVQPACMPGKMEPTQRTECTAGGMGKFKESDSRTSRYLRMMPLSWCGTRRPVDDHPSDQSCWVTSDRKKYPGAMCKGDSGSGVYCPDDPKSATGAQFTSMGLLSNTQNGDCDVGHIRYNSYSDFGLMHDRIMELIEDCSQ